MFHQLEKINQKNTMNKTTIITSLVVSVVVLTAAVMYNRAQLKKGKAGIFGASSK